MTSEPSPPPVPPELSGRHRDTLRHVFAHPVSHNLDWRAVVALLGEVATVDERHDGKIEVTSGERTILLTPPHHKDLDADDVVEVRHFLEAVGYRPEAG